MWRLRSSVLLVGMIMFGLGFRAADADIVYTYTSNPIQLTATCYYNCANLSVSPSTTSLYIDVDFTMPIVGPGTFFNSEDFSAYYQLGGSLYGVQGAFEGSVTLDGFGNIVAWLLSDNAQGPDGHQFGSSSTGDTIGLFEADGRYALIGEAAPGTWSPIFPTPLPATLPFFATGLGVLGLLGWRRKRHPPTPNSPRVRGGPLPPHEAAAS